MFQNNFLDFNGNLDELFESKPSEIQTSVKQRPLVAPQSGTVSTEVALKKIGHIQACISNRFVERQEVIHGAFIAMVARKNMLMVGPPGTAKSDLISSLAQNISGGSYFQWLLTKFTTPEEVFGPVSLRALEQDTYKRVTTGKLPEAHFAFLDECFKGSSAILNALLTLMSERLFYNNGSPTKTPLVSVFGASNEYAEDGENLAALFDRFHLRYELSYISEDDSFTAMLAQSGKGLNKPIPLSLEELMLLQQAADQVEVPQHILDTLLKIRKSLREKEIVPSDRRFVNALSILKANAVLEGRSSVDEDDLPILSHVLWDVIEQKLAVEEVLRQYGDPITGKLDERLAEAKEIAQNALAKEDDPVEGSKAIKALKSLKKEVDDLRGQTTHPGKLEKIVDASAVIQEMIKQINKKCLGIDL
ncbi:AAA domain-containing protein [Heliorestis acidaminivorans]|uniref:AAA domain-containing protein n=1 Tax=Heliorestis acidaminivorans TaxID=553427 RepID=A0A6I0F1E5_9FIRM|nr:AAA family ATPase [Heliorestis acidaminivorans]KAB2952154.1 AAA domain-containing protein [Heliorestis acidaminivorans]